MKVSVLDTEFETAKIIVPSAFEDERGFFMESYSSRTLAEHGIDLTFVQDNHSRSTGGVLRGLHYQAPPSGLWRMVRCTVGAIFDVIVDIDAGSATYGRWAGFDLTAQNRHQLLIPPGFAHGFTVRSDVAEVQYKCTAHHDPDAERAMAWNDPEIGIDWKLEGEPTVSAKDQVAPSFAQYRQNPDFPAR